jgi:hypothetical protein
MFFWEKSIYKLSEDGVGKKDCFFLEGFVVLVALEYTDMPPKSHSTLGC